MFADEDIIYACKPKNNRRSFIMLRKIMIAAVAAVVALSFTACSSLQVATTLNNEKITTAENATSLAHINGEIWGIYLFSIPLFTGSSTQPGRCAIFTDTVQVDNAVSMVTKKALNDFEATTVTDLTSERSSTWLLPFLVIWYNSVQVSGNAIR